MLSDFYKVILILSPYYILLPTIIFYFTKAIKSTKNLLYCIIASVCLFASSTLIYWLVFKLKERNEYIFTADYTDYSLLVVAFLLIVINFIILFFLRSGRNLKNFMISSITSIILLVIYSSTLIIAGILLTTT